MAGSQPSDMPTREAVLEFLEKSDGKITKREIARAFAIRGPAKVHLKRLLRDMIEDGILAQDHARALRPADKLPAVIVAEYAGLDRGGEVLLQPVESRFKAMGPFSIRLKERANKGGQSRGRRQAIGPGDRALVRLRKAGKRDHHYSAMLLKRLDPADKQILGVFRGNENGGRLVPVDKKQRGEFHIMAEGVKGAQDGELVMAEPAIGKRRSGPKILDIRERLGDVTAPRSISLISIHAHDIPVAFSEDAVEQARRAKPPSPEGRTDLRSVKLITIDPSDARDHDDAIFAEADPDTEGGWHAVVAIADVSYFVTPGSALDKDARTRGNSCYFPDRVVPMLPEELSTDLCSLKPGVDRAALVAHLWFDATGELRRHKFERAIIRSHANLAYERVQAALDGKADGECAALLDDVLKPLHACFKAMMAAREKREPLDLDLPERKIILNESGQVTSIAVRERLDAHRIVEELMIAANVAAARQLEAVKMPPMYRVHEEPPLAKLEALRDFLKGYDLSLAKGTVMTPRLFNGLLKQAENSASADQVNEMILRSQTQAYYSPENQGHFGLALPRYAHFTSPIRRYADLVVHRALVRGCKLGAHGLTDEEIAELETIGSHISSTERRAMAAERDATARYIAAYLSDQVGETMTGKIASVTRHGLFVEIQPTGGTGLIPISSMGPEYFIYDDGAKTLTGDKTGKTYNLGEELDVLLLEADPYSGALRLSIVGDDKYSQMTAQRLKKSGRSKPRGRRR